MTSMSAKGGKWSVSIPAWLRALGLGLLAAFAVGIGVSQVTPPKPPNIPAIALAAEPLYAKGARAKPTLTLALSVEFPTVGAQYVAQPHATEDKTYSPDTEYVGYFDPASCYVYNNNADAALRRFDRLGPANARRCNGTGFSGNFMNWASSSAVDILRYGLTGGDRVVDTGSLTVLQRAVLPNTGVSNNFWNNQNFPSKRLLAALARDAVPSVLVSTPAADIFVANCLNRIHFGTQATGSCDSPGRNSDLGTPVDGGFPLVSGFYTGPRPADFTTPFADEYYSGANYGPAFAIAGTQQVIYGASNKWAVITVTDAQVYCSNVWFATQGVPGLPASGDPITGTAKQCYSRTPPAPSQGNVLTADYFFYARVSVCDSTAGGELLDLRPSLCLRYPNGNYKPVGNLQKYSDLVRVSAFGYLNDSAGNPNERYGGVLRAPMKYVGPKYFDSNFSLVSGANPNREWDENTGVFLRDPDSAGGPASGTGSNWPGQPMSGVTNYLNQFGRTGVFGQYKTYDAVGELYYESMRYLQGLPPTDAATTGITDAMRDGFPVDTTWADPHPAVSGQTDYTCVKNNIVGIGDVNTHNDKTIPGNDRTDNDAARSANLSDNEPNFKAWTRVIGAFESNHSGVTYTDGAGVVRTAQNISLNAPFFASDRWGMENQDIGADHASYYMAGIAYWANTHDIRGANWSNEAKRRPGMRVTTYMLDVNEYAEQTDPSRHRNNQFFLAAKYGGFDNGLTGTGNPFKGKKQPGDTDFPDSNVSWERTPNTGEAKNYFLSSSAADVLKALDEIFANVAREANSIAGGAISTQRLTSVGGFIYQAQFDPADWSGDLVAYTVSVDGTTVKIAGTDANSSAAWHASTKLDAKAVTTVSNSNIGAPARNIVVGKLTPDSATATPFLWGSMEAQAIAYLKQSPDDPKATPSDADGQLRLNFLRGDRSQEAPLGTFRKRGAVLGDIVNSGVSYSGPPQLLFSDTAYGTFYEANKDRKKALYVGANDGMLHSFDADTGEELFAYIPSWLVPRLGTLTSPNYRHQSYLDATPTVREAQVGSVWKTVLVGGTGAGGQGVYALDVSDASTFNADKVMWEFTDRDDPDMGNVIGKPQILRMRVDPADASKDKYFAVVGSGVNNYVDDGHFSVTGDPTLFFLDLSKPKGTAWVRNSNYFSISLHDPNPAPSPMTPRGIAGFTVRVGAAGQVTYLYAGDLQGNLWKLDFTRAVKAPDWAMSTLSTFKEGNDAVPMFVATDDTGKRQPITMEPALVFGRNRSIIVAFGTGKFLENSDNSAPYSVQSVYALLDDGTTTTDVSTSAIAGRRRLKAGTVSSASVSVDDFSWGRATEDDGAADKPRSGWYFDFLTSGSSGERQISNMAVLAGKLVFGSVIPAVSSCLPGDGNLYVVDVEKGGGSVLKSEVGILGEPFVAQVGDSTPSDPNPTGLRRQTTRYQVILQGSAGLTAPSSPYAKPSIESFAGRQSWRELSNYQESRR